MLASHGNVTIQRAGTRTLTRLAAPLDRSAGRCDEATHQISAYGDLAVMVAYLMASHLLRKSSGRSLRVKFVAAQSTGELG
jgi:hypothetical protein